jgi:hypothetical protein
VTLEIRDRSNALVRRFSSADKPEQIDEERLAYPSYWFRPPQQLSTKAGMRRFVWDLHYAPPAGFPRSYPISAIYRDTPTVPLGPTVLPGQYAITLTIDGKSYTEQLTVKIDPRVATTIEGLAKMFEVSFGSWEAIARIRGHQADVNKLRSQLQTLKERAGQQALRDAIEALDKKAAALDGASGGAGRAGGGEQSFARLATEFNTVMGIAEGADVEPTTQAVAAYRQLLSSLGELTASWSEIKTRDLDDLNKKLLQANLQPVSMQ